MKSKVYHMTAFFTAVILIVLISGCALKKSVKSDEPVTVYLWGISMMNKYVSYVQSKLPDVEIEFVVGNNDLDYYKFMAENGELPDIITNRRFSLHDAAELKDYLIDLSETELAASYYTTYLENYRNNDGTVNWLPACGEVDIIEVNKSLFDEYNIPLPTDYDSFVFACREFEKYGIRGFVSDFDYDYTCMEILQGLSVSELTSLKGQLWRTNYENADTGIVGLDNEIWPGIFEHMERFIKDTSLTSEDVKLGYVSVQEMYENRQVAMIRETGSAISLHEKSEGVESMLIPYFSRDGEGWLLTYPAFQAAMSKKTEKSGRRDDAMRVLEVMMSDEAQNILAENNDVISYKKDVKLTLREEMKNLQPYIDTNHLYIRLASNEFFEISRTVVQKMICGEYDAGQAYDAFNKRLLNPKKETKKIIMHFEKSYPRVFQSDGGNPAASAMANTLRKYYGADILISPSYNFSGPVLNTDYTEKILSCMIMPNSCMAYLCDKMAGEQIRQLVKLSVEGADGGFTPFNRGSLPVVSGIRIDVSENGKHRYKLEGLSINGKELDNDAVFKVVYLNPAGYADGVLNRLYSRFNSLKFVPQDIRVRNAWTSYFKKGNTLEEPTDYITLK